MRKTVMIKIWIIAYCCTLVCYAGNQTLTSAIQNQGTKSPAVNQIVDSALQQKQTPPSTLSEPNSPPQLNQQPTIVTLQKPAQKQPSKEPNPLQVQNKSETLHHKKQQAEILANPDQIILNLEEKLPQVEVAKDVPTINIPPEKPADKTQPLSTPTPAQPTPPPPQLTIPPPPPSDSTPTPPPEIAHQTLKQQEIQQQKHAAEVANQNNSLKPWIVQQMKQLQQHLEGIVTQSFEFVLDPQSQFYFRWNPSKNKQLRLCVMVFMVTQTGEITLMRDNEQNEYIDITVRNEGETHWSAVGRVYISRIFSVNFDTDYKYFKFTCKLQQSILINVDLQRLQQVVPTDGIAKDQHFSVAQKKMENIQYEVMSGEVLREHTYKYEWGFLDNQYAHESKLLGLTGLELVIIMACAVVQLYFIKNLLDNRAVV